MKQAIIANMSHDDNERLTRHSSLNLTCFGTDKIINESNMVQENQHSRNRFGNISASKTRLSLLRLKCRS